MANVKFHGGRQLPLEMHKVRIVQKLFLPPVEERRRLMNEAGNNTFLLQNKDVFMDMLTDSGVNAMSDLQQSAMLRADDAYAGSETYNRLAAKVRELFHMDYFLPAHQGRAAENVLATAYLKPGDVVPMNFHFTTTKAHITRLGATVEELIVKEGLEAANDCPFKGNFDIPRLEALIAQVGPAKIPFVRVEAGTNLVGGQPLSLQNMREVAAVCRKHGIKLVLDASLLQDNLWFIKQREPACKDWTIRQIVDEVAKLFDIIYFSARKLGFARGGGIAIRDKADEVRMKELIPLYEGFLTYGGMSVREMEAIVVGLDETLDEDVISQGPQFIEYMAGELHRRGIPVVLPAGGLGCHINATPLHRRRRPRHGARHPLRATQRRRLRALRRARAPAPGHAPARLHPLPGRIRHRPRPMALREPPPRRRPHVRRGAQRPALLLRPPRPRRRLAGEARGQVPRGLRRLPLSPPPRGKKKTPRPRRPGRFLKTRSARRRAGKDRRAKDLAAPG